MTLKEYIESLQEFVKENPTSADLTVVTAKDSEGNGFWPVYYSPSIGNFHNNEFTAEEDFDGEDYEINAVCVN